MQKFIYLKSAAVLLIILAVYLYFLLTKSEDQLRQMMYSQAESHIGILAHGSVDDLLSKDYGDLEQWVRQASTPPEYAYVFILSSKGIVLLHSDLGYAGITRKPYNIQQPLQKKLRYENREAIEVIYPIMIEDTFLGTAHLAYYLDEIDRSIREQTRQLLIAHLVFTVLMLLALYLLIRLLIKHKPGNESSH